MKWTLSQKVTIISMFIGAGCTVAAVYTVNTKFMLPFALCGVVFGLVPLFVALTLCTIEAVKRSVYHEANKIAEKKLERIIDANLDEQQLELELENLEDILREQAQAAKV